MSVCRAFLMSFLLTTGWLMGESLPLNPGSSWLLAFCSDWILRGKMHTGALEKGERMLEANSALLVLPKADLLDKTVWYETSKFKLRRGLFQSDVQIFQWKPDCHWFPTNILICMLKGNVSGDHEVKCTSVQGWKIPHLPNTEAAASALLLKVVLWCQRMFCPPKTSSSPNRK